MSEFDTALATYKQAKSKLEEARMALQPLVTEVNEAYTKLCGVCTHPEVHDDHWEDTDGYGGGRWFVRVTCAFCYKELADYRGVRPDGIPKATKITRQGE